LQNTHTHTHTTKHMKLKTTLLQDTQQVYYCRKASTSCAMYKYVYVLVIYIHVSYFSCLCWVAVHIFYSSWNLPPKTFPLLLVPLEVSVT
jgi:hypothetical protein